MLKKAYQEFINKAHAKGLKIYGGTITPIKNTSYWSETHENIRQSINQWIRMEGNFDGVIDFDKVLAAPNAPSAILENLQSDWLHPNAEGYSVMGKYAAEAIRL